MAKQSGDKNVSVVGSYNNISVANNIVHNHYMKPKTKPAVEDNQHNTAVHISTTQQFKIKELVEDIAKMMDVGDGQNYYAKLYGGLKKRYEIPKYSLLPQELFEDAIDYLKKQKNIYRRQLKNISASKFKEVTIPLIKIRCRYLGIDDNDLLNFVYLKFCKKITSIEKLSANDLDTLYSKIYNLKSRPKNL